MIGRSLNERHVFGLLPEERAVTILREAMAKHAPLLVQVRKQDPAMIALLFLHADKQVVKLCRELGLALELGGSGVMGLLGDDAARLLPALPDHDRDWMRTPCGPRETKVLLFAGGRALLSIVAEGGEVTIRGAGAVAS